MLAACELPRSCPGLRGRKVGSMFSRKAAFGTVMAAVCGFAASAQAQTSQLRLNEIFRNPPGSSDNKWQYIELHGCPNTNLSGLAVVVIVDDGSTAEIDECFVFDKGTESYQTNSNGLFVIWNSSSSDASIFEQSKNNNSEIYNDKFPVSIKVSAANQSPAGTLNNGDFIGNPSSNVVTRFEASFKEIGNPPSGETTGDLAGNGSMTVLLIDLAANGLTAAQVEKDDVWDANRDGTPETIYQGLTVIDEISVSDGGNREYTTSEANEIDFTAGFNPDAFVRLNDVLPANEKLPGGNGTLFNISTSSSDDYRSAYTEWAYGEINGTASLDFDEGFGAVIDPGAGNTVNVQSQTASGDPEDIDGLNLTPGLANESYSADANDDSTLDSTGGQRTASCGALRHDPNADGRVDLEDILTLADQGDLDAMLEAVEIFFNK